MSPQHIEALSLVGALVVGYGLSVRSLARQGRHRDEDDRRRPDVPRIELPARGRRRRSA